MESEPTAIIDALSEPAWTACPDGQIDFFNRRWCKYTGLNIEQARGHKWQAAVHPGDLPNLLARWEIAVTSGEDDAIEARLRRMDGKFRWFHISVSPNRDQTGRIVKWYGLNFDIEDRKRAEQALRSGERDLRSVIDTIPMKAWSTDADGYCDFVNQRWLDYTGLSTDQIQGWGWRAAIHPNDLDSLVEHWRSCLNSGAPLNTEARMRRFDGVYRWFLFLGNPLRERSGNIVKWFGTNVDIEDRKRIEEELRANERKLTQIINTIPTTAWSTHPDGYCDFLSDRWLEYAGFTYEQAVGWRWAAAIHPEDAAGLQEHWQRCLSAGTAVNTEARIRRYDGVYRWFLFLAQPFRDESGAIVKWYGTNVDIEDRKRADEALRASERNLIQIINTIPTLAWSNDPDGHVDFLNHRWLEFTGLTAEQAGGWGWSSAIHRDDARALVAYWQQALAAGTEVDIEARMRRFDGEYRRFLFRANPLRDGSGNIVKWYGTNTDIEDRKRVEEELRRSEAFLAEGQRLNLTGTFSWRLDTGEITVSHQFYRIYEFAHDEPVTLERLASRVHPEDLAMMTDKLEQARRGNAHLNYEFRLLMPNASIKYLRMVAHAIDGEEGWPEIMGAVQDVTERRLWEEALGRLRSELARVARVSSFGALTASIAHEVNQPLGGIITNASTCLRMLAADPPNVEGALETAHRMIRDGLRASDVITRLRALFSRKETARELVDLNEATREVIALAMSDFQRRKVVLRTQLADSLPKVQGDRVQLQQVILNLLLNASEAMSGIGDRPRQVLIKTERDALDSIRLSVQDAGVGFEISGVDKLFEAFYTTKSGGMGIGLSVSRSIIEYHRGHLWAELNDGPGATFIFSIPGRHGESATAESSIATQTPEGLPWGTG
jgi:PAS domain S-box-containing protein